MAIGDHNSSGLLSKGILDEMRNNIEEQTKPSGRFKEVSMRNSQTKNDYEERFQSPDRQTAFQ